MLQDIVLMIKRDCDRIVPDLAGVLRKWDFEKTEDKVLFVLMYVDTRFNDYGYLRTEICPKGYSSAGHIGWFDGGIQLVEVEGGKAVSKAGSDSYYTEQAQAIIDAIVQR